MGAETNREIVSCRACVRAEPMLGGNIEALDIHEIRLTHMFQAFPFALGAQASHDTNIFTGTKRNDRDMYIYVYVFRLLLFVKPCT